MGSQSNSLTELNWRNKNSLVHGVARVNGPVCKHASSICVCLSAKERQWMALRLHQCLCISNLKPWLKAHATSCILFMLVRSLRRDRLQVMLGVLNTFFSLVQCFICTQSKAPHTHACTTNNTSALCALTALHTWKSDIQYFYLKIGVVKSPGMSIGSKKHLHSLSYSNVFPRRMPL